jgi:hypothetical protein
LRGSGPTRIDTGGIDYAVRIDNTFILVRYSTTFSHVG